MNRDYEQTEFSKSVLAGVFAGIIATVLGLIYNAYFREINGFSLSEIINVSSIIFSLVLLVTIAGLIFYVFHHYLKRGTIVFQFVSVIVTALLIAGAMQLDRSGDPLIAKAFRQLLAGIIGITGLCTVFFIPFLFKTDYV
jgi:hypothetical protein